MPLKGKALADKLGWGMDGVWFIRPATTRLDRPQNLSIKLLHEVIDAAVAKDSSNAASVILELERQQVLAKQQHDRQEAKLQELCTQLLSMVTDLKEGYPMRELGIDLAEVTSKAKTLGVTLDPN